jgi:phosphoribosylglycinamide formyltransferase 2
LAGPSASAVILADRESHDFSFEGAAEALGTGQSDKPVDLRIFAKPNTLKNRRMGVALARAATVDEAVERAVQAAGKIAIDYRD